VLQQIGAPNHFTLVEGWADRGAFEAHEASAAARALRAKLQPILGSPFDERLHHALP
jgi:quinol monooxygenase YgiN